MGCYHHGGTGKELLKQETRVTMDKKQIKDNDTKIQFLFTKRHPQEKEKMGHIKPIKDSYSK